MKKLLWLDDYRDPMEGQWLVFSPITLEDLEVYWVKSYQQFIDWIITNDLPDAICFDHDLGLEVALKLDLKVCLKENLDYLKKKKKLDMMLLNGWLIIVWIMIKNYHYIIYNQLIQLVKRI